MRKLAIILILIVFNNLLFGQDKTHFLSNELCLSVNRSNIKDDNTQDRYGFGLSALHSFFTDKFINLTFGIEFNRTSQFKKYMHGGPAYYSTNVTYFIDNYSLPLLIRLNLGNKFKIFIETGSFIDLIIFSKEKGIGHMISINPSYPSSEKHFEQEAGLADYNYGYSFGFGIKLPVSNYGIIIKSDYKFGKNVLYEYQQTIVNSYGRILIGLMF